MFYIKIVTFSVLYTQLFSNIFRKSIFKQNIKIRKYILQNVEKKKFRKSYHILASSLSKVNKRAYL